MKTLHVTNAWHSTSGGIATFYRALLRQAEDEKQALVLVAPGAEDREETVGRYGRIYTVRAPRAPFNRNYRLLFPYHYLWPAGRLPTILRREQPRLVEISDKYTLPYMAGLLRKGWLPGYGGRPTVVGLSCERMDDNVSAYLVPCEKVQRLIDLYLRRLYFPMCDHHIAVSAYAAAELDRPSRGQHPWRGVWAFPLGVDCELFRPEARSPHMRARLLERVSGSETSALILYCGRLAREKNLDLLTALIELLAQDPGRDCRLLVAGEGGMRESFLAEAESRAPGRVHWLGFVTDRSELAALYAGCDVFVHPNPAEPFGIAPLEAMAAGLPVVAPNAGGVLTYASVSNAWLEPPRADCFAAAVRSILDDPGDRLRRTVRARETALERGWPAIASRYLRLYRDLDRLTRGEPVEAIEPPAFTSFPATALRTQS